MLPNVLGHKNMFINKNKVFSGLTVNDAKIAIYNTSLKSHGEVNVVAARHSMHGTARQAENGWNNNAANFVACVSIRCKPCNLLALAILRPLKC